MKIKIVYVVIFLVFSISCTTPKAKENVSEKKILGYVTKGIDENQYVDTNVAIIGKEERALLESMEGKWKRPLYNLPGEGFEKDWEEITSYPIPEWLLDAKFGMYTHWGVYSVPAYLGNTYIRNMYTPNGRDSKPLEKSEKTYKYHLENYGDPTEFGYTDFIPLFKAEKYKGEDFVKLMQETGAKFGGLGVVHHDGFLMWDSKVNRWNVGNMGPKKDLYGEFVEAARKANFKTLATFHHARSWNYPFKDIDPNFYSEEQKKKLDIFDPDKSDFFFGMPGGKVSIEDFAKQWKEKIIEVVDKYHPDLLWFDGIQRTNENSPEKYLVEALKHYLKSGTENGQEPVICNKLPGGNKEHFCHFNFPENTGIRCYEGGRNMPPDAGEYWLTDRAISYPWSYTHDKSYNLGPDVHIRALVDQTARGGIYLLSLTPMASGEIHPKEKAICKGIGDWLKINGEAIYNTRRWKIPAEGPITSWRLVENREGIMWDYKKANKEGEYRFTRSKDGKTVYAIMMVWPENGKAIIKTLAKNSDYLDKKIKSVELLGSDQKLEWKRTEQGLEIILPDVQPCNFAYSFKIR
ncbi:MAG: alpha-L-fucosidase [Prolixibacteraceae bacterium]|nr:alpha-L-fucosidase [Prolixibacteraceae bacterium]